MLRLLLAICITFFSIAAVAQERPRAILVLDASGSMWGQIDGVNKIVIARDVIGDLLQTLPAEQELGLTVYGHRRKGDCGDIETVVMPDGDQRDAIAAAVNSITPKGKTPLSAAVIQAAEALHYTEERATVILVSDGKETCEFDPCEVGRKLEAAGVDFTAHVIGFDVTNPADRAQLQCLAEETGGSFRTASNAGELADALTVVAEPPAPPAPQPFDVTLNAIEGPGGPTITKGLSWQLSDAAGTVLLDGGADMTPTLELLPGNYTAQVLRDVDGAAAERGFTVEATHKTVKVVLPELPPEPVKVHIIAKDGKNGARIDDQLVWDLTGGGETILDTELAGQLNLELTKGEYVVSVMRPADEATAEVRFGVGKVGKTVTVVLPEYRPLATLDAADTAIAGSAIDVRWTGPDAHNDFISIATVGANKNTWEGYTYTREGPLLKLQMPPEPGDYEIRYVLSEGRKVLVTRSVTVTPVSATITPPASAAAGADAVIDWTGPDYKSDFIAVVKPGEDAWINYTYTREGSPLKLTMPPEPGAFELVYTMNQDRTVIVRVPISVTGIDVSVSVPAAAAAGSQVVVDWVGPDYKNDYIAIAEVGADEGKWLHYSYTREGSPLTLQVPLEPGTYEVRYVLSQDRKTEARTTLEVTALTAGISGPGAGVAGASVLVEWKGPGYRNDYVAIAPVGAEDHDYASYTYVRDGSPVRLQLPTKAGEYELRYIAASAGKVLLARQPITLTPVSATLEAPASAAAGSNLVVTWTGPDYRNDYLGIGKVGEEGYDTYAYTRDGSPMKITVPDAPGQYELRYFLGQDRTQIGAIPLTVE